MTTVGMTGGLGPESTIDYYRRILAAWEREDPSTAPSTSSIVWMCAGPRAWSRAIGSTAAPGQS
jgi:aspartate/glutamate racemase